MKKIIKNELTLDEKLEDFRAMLIVRRYNLDHRPINSISDVFYYVQEYLTQYEYYLNDLKHNRCNVPDEAHFVFNLPFIDSIKFISLLHEEFGFLYYPGINNTKETIYTNRYYEVKKEFISKKYHIPYIKPEVGITYSIRSVFPSKEAQDIAYGIVLDTNAVKVNKTDNDNISKLDNYFDDPTRFFTFDEGYYDGYSRTKGDK